jgi:glycine betaine/proline transport system permease protein
MPDIPIGAWGEAVVNFMRDHFAVLFDLIAAVMTGLLRSTYLALVTLTPVALVVLLVLIAFLASRRVVLPLLLGVGLLLVISMDLWDETMQTMATVIVASLISLLIAVPLGIWAAFSPTVRAIATPVLDFMQTVPTFVYLLPTVLFFGIGPVPGVVATIIFAAPPAVRLTQLGIRQVDAETVEAAHAFGATRGAILREVQLPLARPSIMAGVNQVIMLALSMVVVAGLVGGGGLGSVVVSSVQSLQIGTSVEGGLAVVILAIYLDRVSAALGGQGRGNPSWWPQRRRRTTGGQAAATSEAAPEKEAAAEKEPIPA